MIADFPVDAIPDVAAVLKDADGIENEEIFYRVDDAIRFLGRPSMSAFYRHIRNKSVYDAGANGRWRIIRNIGKPASKVMPISSSSKETVQQGRHQPRRKAKPPSPIAVTAAHIVAKAAATAAVRTSSRTTKRKEKEQEHGKGKAKKEKETEKEKQKQNVTEKQKGKQKTVKETDKELATTASLSAEVLLVSKSSAKRKRFKEEIDYTLLAELFWPGKSKHLSSERIIPEWVYNDGKGVDAIT